MAEHKIVLEGRERALESCSDDKLMCSSGAILSEPVLTWGFQMTGLQKTNFPLTLGRNFLMGKGELLSPFHRFKLRAYFVAVTLLGIVLLTCLKLFIYILSISGRNIAANKGK